MYLILIVKTISKLWLSLCRDILFFWKDADTIEEKTILNNNFIVVSQKIYGTENPMDRYGESTNSIMVFLWDWDTQKDQ